MKIAAVSLVDFHLAGADRFDWCMHCFALSRNALSFREIPDSAFATPARYVQEMFNRLCLLETGKPSEEKFIFNPLFETNRPSLLLALRALRSASPFEGASILVNAENLPLGYLLPSSFGPDDSRFLTLLSTVDGRIDMDLLGRLFHIEVRWTVIPHLHLRRFDNNGFSYRLFQEVYRWIAEAAINALATCAYDNPTVSATRRNAIPFTAIMPFHAGDALFFSLAFNTTSHISRIAVNRVYSDVVADNAPALKRLVLDLPPPNRKMGTGQAHAIPDHVYFEQIKPLLPTDGFYYFCRQSRNYNLPDFHLIDQFAFALGNSCYRHRELPSQRSLTGPTYQPQEAMPQRILLHFDGGWPLKIYPALLQDRLITLLQDAGYAITVLTSEIRSHVGCRVVKFTNYAELVALLKVHHLLIGMDSFPCHLGAHVLRLPTICLFSSTKPANSNAANCSRYTNLEEGLRCRPCYAARECPVYRTPYCHNFVAPERVASEVDRMLKAIQTGELPLSSKSHDLTTEVLSLTHEEIAGAAHPGRLVRVNLRHLEVKAALAGFFVPFYCYSSTLHREFVASVKREGIGGAMRRTARYLHRTLLDSLQRQRSDSRHSPRGQS